MSPNRKLFSNLTPIPRFILKFVFLLVAFALILGYLCSIFPEAVSGLVSATAELSRILLAATGAEATRYEAILNMNQFSVEVVLECAGVYQILIFSAAVLAFPTQPKKKLWGILLAAPIFYLLDVARVAVVLLVGNSYPDLFDFMHIYTLQVFVIAIVVLLWLVWVKKMAYAGENF